MKTGVAKIGAALLAIGICAWCTDGRAQGTTTESVATRSGAFTEFVPASETVVIRSETNPIPVHYVVTKQTIIVDEAGAPVEIEKFWTCSSLSVQYTGERLAASRIVVRDAPVATGSSAP